MSALLLAITTLGLFWGTFAPLHLSVVCRIHQTYGMPNLCAQVDLVLFASNRDIECYENLDATQS